MFVMDLSVFGHVRLAEQSGKEVCVCVFVCVRKEKGKDSGVKDCFCRVAGDLSKRKSVNTQFRFHLAYVLR